MVVIDFRKHDLKSICYTLFLLKVVQSEQTACNWKTWVMCDSSIMHGSAEKVTCRSIFMLARSSSFCRQQDASVAGYLCSELLAYADNEIKVINLLDNGIRYWSVVRSQHNSNSLVMYQEIKNPAFRFATKWKVPFSPESGRTCASSAPYICSQRCLSISCFVERCLPKLQEISQEKSVLTSLLCTYVPPKIRFLEPVVYQWSSFPALLPAHLLQRQDEMRNRYCRMHGAHRLLWEHPDSKTYKPVWKTGTSQRSSMACMSRVGLVGTYVGRGES